MFLQFYLMFLKKNLIDLSFHIQLVFGDFMFRHGHTHAFLRFALYYCCSTLWLNFILEALHLFFWYYY